MLHADLSTLPDPSDAPRLVLDTNVVLGWLLFRDPACAALDEALTSGRAIWVASIAMHDELAHVLARGTLSSWQPDLDAIVAARERWAHTVAPLSTPTPARLRCTDPDDQKFIDLALQLGSASLLSRDRAVLKLARRAREAGVSILTPEAWARQRLPVH